MGSATRSPRYVQPARTAASKTPPIAGASSRTAGRTMIGGVCVLAPFMRCLQARLAAGTGSRARPPTPGEGRYSPSGAPPGQSGRDTPAPLRPPGSGGTPPDIPLELTLPPLPPALPLSRPPPAREDPAHTDRGDK